ncbi:MAG: hypothetical protein R3D03_15450 [Geminicoccaceae bacterium]
MNIAMWSGPRNLSTAMMRSFSQRTDCTVADEPFYAAYLQATGLDHPMRDAIIAAGETDPATVMAQCASPGPKAHFYQKHMTHHMLPQFDLGWLGSVRNAFLIRHPARVVASYNAKREDPTLDDLGFVEQERIFERASELEGRSPPVIDAADVRANPQRVLGALCEGLGIAFDPAMLKWPPGPHPDDGVWGSHWYKAIWESTGFAPPETGEHSILPDNLRRLVDQAMPIYERLSRYRIGAD